MGQITRNLPRIVDDTSRVTLKFDRSKILFVHFQPGSKTYTHTKNSTCMRWFASESSFLQTPTTTTTPDNTVQTLGRHIANINRRNDGYSLHICFSVIVRVYCYGRVSLQLGLRFCTAELQIPPPSSAVQQMSQGIVLKQGRWQIMLCLCFV